MTLGMALSWRPADLPENRIFVGAIATIAVGATQAVLNAFDVFGSKAMTELLAFLCCVWLFPHEQRMRWSVRLSILLISAGLIGGALWIAFIGYPARNESQFLTWDNIPFEYYSLGLITGCIVAPLFEEKVVRHLLLSGASHYLGRSVGAIAVSALFAWVHTDGVVSAFIFSMALCCGVYFFKMDGFQRSLIHGFVNLVIMHWAIIYPNI